MSYWFVRAALTTAHMCCRKRETLTGDATVRYFDYLDGFAQFNGILPNLFTEISTSKERSFPCVDFVDTPGLVDGDTQVRTAGLHQPCQ